MWHCEIASFFELRVCIYLTTVCITLNNKEWRLMCTAEVAFPRCFTSWCTGNLNINIHHILISLFLCQAQNHLELRILCFAAITLWFCLISLQLVQVSPNKRLCVIAFRLRTVMCGGNKIPNVFLVKDDIFMTILTHDWKLMTPKSRFRN